MPNIGKQIKLLVRVGKHDIGSIGTIDSHCGCVGLPKITVKMADNDYIILFERQTRGYEKWVMIDDI
jgi:hypothetical protein